MEQQIFKQSTIGLVVIPLVITVGIFFFFLSQGNNSPALFLILLIPIIFIIGAIRTKLVIDGDVLRYEKVIGGEEIELNKVSQIISREIELISTDNISTFNHNREQQSQHTMRAGNERHTEKVIYVLDESGRTFFSFPASLVSLKNRRRFEEAVTAVNPNIQVF